ncbi:M1 family aminopeptidase [Fibrella sp. WM1]|uniref:M1 family aminopeptidase n=1 Tax=Fibrella musci TaxID=3242485 RepID=UPI003520C23C
MNYLFLIGCLLTTSVLAQTNVPDANVPGTDACVAGKVRFFGQPGRLSGGSARLMGPAVQSAGDATIDVTYYGLDLRLTHTPNYLTAATTVALRPASSAISQFFLDLNSVLKVDSVKSNGQRLTFAHASNRLTITLPQTLAAGQTGRVTVYYQGVPPNTDDAFVFTTHGTGGTANPLIYSLSEPYGASNWFPCKDTPADKADSSAVNITAAPIFVSVSNGLLQGVTTNADGTKTYRWKNSYPIAQYLISIACANYQQYDTPFSYNGQTMPVTHYLFPEDAATYKTAVDETNNMMRVFSDLFGTYPFIREKYGHAEFGYAGGMEHQTVSSMAPNALTRNVISHELMHQWFGDKITCRDWQNIWLNEGFASYGEAVYQEAIGGRTAYKAYMDAFMTQALLASGTLYVQNVNSINEIFSSSRSYAKGATVLHMLRGVLGDSTFYKGMRAYATSPLSYSTAVTEDFQRVMEQSSGQKLDYFFKEWVYGERYPTYQWSIAPVAGTSTAVLSLTQTAGSNPTSFTMPIQVTVQSAAGDRTVTVVNNQPIQSFTVTGSGAVTGALFDPNNWILKRAQQVTPPTGGTAVILATQEAINLRVFPNPTADQLTVEFATQQPGPLTLSLVNLLGQTVLTQPETNVPSGQQRRTIGLGNVPSGQYVLRLQTADGVKSTSVVK